MAKQRRVRLLLLLAVVIATAAVIWDRFLIEGNSFIRVYGRIVDRDGRGIPGVKVEAQVWTYDFFGLPIPFYAGANSHFEPATLVTDDGGRFHISSWRAKSVIFRGFRKDGYQEPQAGQAMFHRPNWRSPTRPIPDDPNSPIVYTMLPAP